TFLLSSHETTIPACSDGFDLTLTDGRYLLKCLLSTSLNPLVYQGTICARGIIKVIRWRRQLDVGEGCELLPPCVILTQLSADGVPREPCEAPLPPHPSPRWLLQAMRVPLGEGSPHFNPRPLMGRRAHYLRLESNEVQITEPWREAEPQGVLWSQPAHERKGKKKVKKKAAKTGQPNDRVQEIIEDVEERILMQDFPDLSRIASSEESETMGNFKRKISDEEEEDERKRGKRRPFSKGENPPLLGRVARKGALHHFGKLNGERQPLRFPVKFEFWLAADGNEVRIIVWNRLCQTYYELVQVDDVVVVVDYSLRKWQVSQGEYEWVFALNPGTACLPPIPHLSWRALTTQLDASAEDEDSFLRAQALDGSHPPPSCQRVRRVLAAVLRVFPVHRRRLDNPDGCIAFYRARWLLVLPVDGGPSFPIHLLGHHTTTAFEQVLGVRCHGSVEESMLVQFEHMTIHSAGEEESTGRDLYYLRSTQTTFLSWGLALALVDDSHVDRAAKCHLSPCEQIATTLTQLHDGELHHMIVHATLRPDPSPSAPGEGEAQGVVVALHEPSGEGASVRASMMISDEEAGRCAQCAE
ncbi:MAG: hypothetical protein SGPRY_006356, partial [Prymnesium sp.]